MDLGLRMVDGAKPSVEIIHPDKFKSPTQQQRRWLKRRQAVELTIEYLKHDNGMDRCWLQGAKGDARHAVLCTARTTSNGCCGRWCTWVLRAFLRVCWPCWSRQPKRSGPR